MQNSDQLDIKVSGKETDHLLFQSFLIVANNTFKILKAIDTQDEVDWRVERLSLNSPLLMSVGGESGNGEAADAIELCLDLFTSLSEGRSPSLRVPPAALEPVRKLTAALNDGVANIEFSSPARQPVAIDWKKVRATVTKLVKRQPLDYSEETSISGELQTISVAGGGTRVYIHDRLTDQQIECKVDAQTYRELFAIGNMNRRVMMHGRVLFKKDNPSVIHVRSYEFLPSGEQAAFLGPEGIDITDGEDSVKYLRRLRGGE